MPPYKVNVSTVTGKLNMLIYGDSGAGKTHFAATAQDHPDLSPVLVLNSDQGLVTLAARGDIDAEDVGSIDAVEEIFWKIINKDPLYAKYKTVIIDSVTELQTLNLTELVIKNIKAKGTQKTRTQDDVYLEDYKKSTNMLKRLFRMFRDAPVNIIFIATANNIMGGSKENPVVEKTIPNLTQQLSKALMQYVDFAWYLFKDEDEKGNRIRKILTETHGGYQAKTRGAEFTKVIGLTYDNPNIPDLYELYLKSEGV